jgi:hypothetical protein
MAVMMPDKRHVEIKRPQMDAKCHNWRREANGGERGNSKNSADLSHDPAVYVAFEGVATSKVRTTINVPFWPLFETAPRAKALSYCWPPL